MLQSELDVTSRVQTSAARVDVFFYDLLKDNLLQMNEGNK